MVLIQENSNCRRSNIFWIVLFILITLPFVSQEAFGLFEFDEFTDDFGQFIQETVENEDGNVCLNCNVSITVNFPNGTFHVFELMPFNTSSNKCYLVKDRK